MQRFNLSGISSMGCRLSREGLFRFDSSYPDCKSERQIELYPLGLGSKGSRRLNVLICGGTISSYLMFYPFLLSVQVQRAVLTPDLQRKLSPSMLYCDIFLRKIAQAVIFSPDIFLQPILLRMECSMSKCA